jgi:tryptophanyl-tRNA synthetase
VKCEMYTHVLLCFLKEGARIMSLLDATDKMSKSAENDNSRINLLDPPEVIRRKIKKCKTDSGVGSLNWDKENRPEATNLLNIYKVVCILCTVLLSLY